VTGFSNRTLQVIEGFARNMDIQRITPAGDGSVTFDIERAGRLCFAPSHDRTRLLISLKRMPAYLQVDDLKRFFTLSQWDPYIGLSINAGMSADDGLVLVASLDEPSVDLSAVEQCVDRLISLHDDYAGPQTT